MEVHKYAKFFPVMEGEEFAALVADIKEHGLLEPIVILDEKILDGRNRFKACQRAGVDPKFEKYRGTGNGDALDYVISKNVKRRHLTTTQLGVLALDLEKEIAKVVLPEERREMASTSPDVADVRSGHATRSAAIAGKMLGISRKTVNRAKRVAQDAPELLDDLRTGKKSAREAEHEIRIRAARASNARATKKKVQKEDRQVKRYLNAIKAFIAAASDARDAAAYGKFSPEAQRFTIREHERVRKYMAGIEEKF